MNISAIISKNNKAGKQNAPESDLNFFQFVWQKNKNRRFVWIALTGMMVQFVIFKLLYPFADFFSDSYSYIFAAKANLDVSVWPIGYSKFLRAFHFITSSDTALVSFQYFFLELSCLYFFFTILYFYKPIKNNQVILFIFLFFDPLFLYISNYVNSDPLFIALSILWFTELLWIMHRPNVSHIVLQALLLFTAFTIRNNAYIYPFVAAAAFSLSRLRLWVKIAGTSLGLLFIIPFIMHTRNASYKITGTKMFSLFTGWQLANNSLYMYEYADTSKKLSAESRELDKLSIWFYSHVPKDFRSDYLLTNPGNFFIQQKWSPLKLYLNRHYKLTDDYNNVIAWGKASILFEEYGKYLILNNKGAYLHKFMIPNAKNYFIPHLEKLAEYNLGQNKVETLAQQWFHYKSDTINSVSIKAQNYILYIFPFLFLIINAYWLISMIVFWLQEKYKNIEPTYNQSILLINVFFVLNFLFSVFATIIVMRYQVFPMIVCVPFSLLLTEWLDKKRSQGLINEAPLENRLLNEVLMMQVEA